MHAVSGIVWKSGWGLCLVVWCMYQGKWAALCLCDGVAVLWHHGAGNRAWQTNRSGSSAQANQSSLLMIPHSDDCLLVLVHLSSVCVAEGDSSATHTHTRTHSNRTFNKDELMLKWVERRVSSNYSVFQTLATTHTAQTVIYQLKCEIAGLE